VTKRWIAIVLALASCSHRAGGASAVHELRVADLAGPASLDPLLAHDQDTIGFDLLFAQTLVGLSEENRLVPILITRVPSRANGDISRDGRTIVYRLRQGVRFADGRLLTSADVAFTFRAILDPRNPVLSQDAYRRIASLKTPDRSTVVVRLRSPWNAAVRELFAQSDFAFGILPSHAFTSTAVTHAPWEEAAFGTGPFRVTQWRRGDRVVLEPNPYFSPRPQLARIELRMIPDVNSALVALRTGEVDLVRVPAMQVPEVTKVPGLRIAVTALNGMDYLALQTTAAPTNDLHVRRAIAEALDVPLVENVFHGVYPRAAAFLPPTFAWHHASLAPIARNDRAAAAELDAAGWRWQNGVRRKNGAPLDVLLVAQGRTGFASILQRQLAAIGMNATLKTFPPTVFNAPDGPLRTGRFNIAAQGWIGGADPEQSVVFACGQIGPDGNNIARFCDPRFDAAYRDQAITADERRRASDFLAMQEIVYDRVPIVPLNYTRYFDAVNSRVRGFARNMLGYPVGAEKWDAK
jgi:peptide/nickel transport system substrate-binding protein